tara:strand:- start:349 stop:651 length:303 start_codon:yes stop_codon:yes gene_type:complete
MFMRSQQDFVWVVEKDLIFGLDTKQKQQIKIKTGGSHWLFSFTELSGTGKVRIGKGCDYNPLVLIQDMFFHVKNGINLPVMDIEFNDDSKLSDDFRNEWE